MFESDSIFTFMWYIERHRAGDFPSNYQMPTPHIPGCAKCTLIYMMVKEDSAVITSFCLFMRDSR